MKKITIIGAGTMGNGIAHVFAIHGFNVKLFDIHKESLDRAIKTIEKNMSRQVEKGILTATEAESSLGNIELINEMNLAVESADLVLEAATENDVREFARSRLADFKVPRKVLILDEIPKGATGKLQRIGLAAKLGLG